MTAILDKRAYSTSSFGGYMVCETSEQDGRGGSHGQGNSPHYYPFGAHNFRPSIDENGEFVCGGRCLFSSVRNDESGLTEEPDGYWGTGNTVLPINKVPCI